MLEFMKNDRRSKKIDPYKHVRRQISRPGWAIKPNTTYRRSKNKKVVEEELEEWQDDLDKLGVDIIV